MKPKLCYVLPASASHTHFAYIGDFLAAAAERLDIFLIVEKGAAPEAVYGKMRVYEQKFSFFLLRWLENFLVLAGARARGFKKFYIHYSFLSALNAAIVARISGGMVFYWNAGLPWNYKRPALREFFERLTYRAIHFLVTGTEGLARQYAEHYGLPISKIKVMPNWIDVARITNHESRITEKEIRKELKILSDTKIILFVHRLSRRKGAQYLPEIMDKLCDLNVVMIVVGDGPEHEALELGIRNNELWDRVRLLGARAHEEVLDYFAAADVFLMPSEEEGFPHVLLESMAMGVPFVAFDVGGVREMTPSACARYIYKVGDVSSLALGVRELLTSEEAARAIRAASEEWVKRYDLPVVLEKFIQIVA